MTISDPPPGGGGGLASPTHTHSFPHAKNENLRLNLGTQTFF